jgi:hypothetical protein
VHFDEADVGIAGEELAAVLRAQADAGAERQRRRGRKCERESCIGCLSVRSLGTARAVGDAVTEM